MRRDACLLVLALVGGCKYSTVNEKCNGCEKNLGNTLVKWWHSCKTKTTKSCGLFQVKGMPVSLDWNGAGGMTTPHEEGMLPPHLEGGMVCLNEIFLVNFNEE